MCSCWKDPPFQPKLCGVRLEIFAFQRKHKIQQQMITKWNVVFFKASPSRIFSSLGNLNFSVCLIEGVFLKLLFCGTQMEKGNLLTRALFLIDADQSDPCSELWGPLSTLENFFNSLRRLQVWGRVVNSVMCLCCVTLDYSVLLKKVRTQTNSEDKWNGIENQVVCETGRIHSVYLAKRSGLVTFESWQPQTKQRLCVLSIEREGWKDMIFTMHPYE